MKANLEWREQAVVVELLRAAKIGFFAIPNGGQMPVQYRMKLKRMGVQPGVPDLFIVTPPPEAQDFIGLFLEMKRAKGGVTSPEQKAWHELLRGYGYAVVVAHGFDEAKKALEEFGYLG